MKFRSAFMSSVCLQPVEYRHAQQGVTLVEMMIAFALSAILITGVVKIFESNKLAFNMQDGMSRIQESGRVATELMAREIRNAGFMGCATGGSFRSVVDPAKYNGVDIDEMISLLDGNNAIVGFDDVTAIAASTTLANFGLSVGTAVGNLVSGTDVLVMHHARPCAGGKVTDGGTGTAQLKVEDAASCGIDQGDIVIVSNCLQAEAFGITSNASSTDTLAHGSNWNIDVKLEGNYEEDSYVYKPTSMLFYVGVGASGEPALYMKSLNDVSDKGVADYGAYELAEGVENMQILYGEDTDDDDSVNRYVTADDVSDMNEVIALRTSYLLRSPTGATTAEQTYTYNGAETTTDDGRLREAYETTSTIRNRVLGEQP